MSGHSKKMLVSAFALSLVLSGCLFTGSGHGAAAGASARAQLNGHGSQTGRLQDAKVRWRKQAEKLRTGCFPIVNEAAQAIGMDPSELRGQLAQGRSIAEAAAGRGISESDLAERLLDARTSKLNEAVRSGAMARERADSILAKMKSHIGYMLRKKGLEEPGPGHGHKSSPRIHGLPAEKEQ